MAKTRAQRKAERRRRAAQQAQAGTDKAPADSEQARHDTQVPESADVAEAELAERGADLEELKGPAPSRADVGAPAAPEPEQEEAAGDVVEDKISRRARRRAEREERRRAKESEARRAARREEAPERQRGAVIGFFISCWAELKRVQWPDRETLIQASAITLIFIAIMAAYLGVLDAAFNWLVQRIL